MFVLLLYVAVISVFLTILTFSMSSKNTIFRYALCIISGLLVFVLVAAFMTDLFFYIKGDKVSYEYVKLSKTETLGYFTLNDTYRGVGGHFSEYKMIAKQNEKDMEIRFVETKADLEDKLCAIYYLPVSKFVTCIKAPAPNNIGYNDIYKYSYRTYETRVIKHITVLCVVIFILVYDRRRCKKI